MAGLGLYEFDMALQRPVFYMMRRGIRVDPALRKERAEKAHEDWQRDQKNLNTLATWPVNVLSTGGKRPDMRRLLYEELNLPVRRKKKKVTTDEDAIRSLMAYTADKHGKLVQEEAKARWLRAYLCLRLVLNVRGVRKKLSGYLECPLDNDGRARCTMSVGGTETMRFSHSKTLWDTGLNLATVPHEERTWFIADDGYELAEFDLNRGESWVYTYLSLDPELMRIHNGGLDFHSETAAIIQSAFARDGQETLSPDEIRRLNKQGDSFAYRIRYLGKKVNHASAYRMGPFRAAQVVNEESDETNITVVASQMEKAQKLWRQKYPGIKSWWDEIDIAVENHRELWTPWGRHRQFFGYMSDHLKKEATAYVPQSTSVDYLNHGMLRVYDDLVAKGAFGLELLHQNHDSILVQYPIQHRTEVFPEIISRLESTPVTINGFEVTIPVEGMYGQNWGDYHPEKNPNGLHEMST